MSAFEEQQARRLLKEALAPMKGDAAPDHDLWPEVSRRIGEDDAPATRSRWIWFDWALAAGLALMAVAFPASIPLLLYCL